MPASHRGRIVELIVDLGFANDRPGFDAEGMFHDASGQPLKGLHPRNRQLRVSQAGEPGERVRVYVEASANPTILAMGPGATPSDSFRPTTLGSPETAGQAPLYTLGRVELAAFSPEIFALAMDVDVLCDLAEQLDPGAARRREVLSIVSDALALLDVLDVPGTTAPVRAGLAAAFTGTATAGAHQLTAVAHAHIDSAWLWPVRETKRKCAHTFANVTALANDYPDLVFACSSAQQYAWIRDEQPSLWKRIRDAVAAGTWEPVGGMWVEPDGMIPSGESLARQLLLGQGFFTSEFGRPCPGMWLPDSFGYTAAYPQIALLGGTSWFLTQKISWNDTNTFPHHTFWWEGIDGSRILTHFPPADTYNADLGGADVHRSAAQHRERGRSRKALVPFGFGDGGGGPEREMLERARRLADLEGSPTVHLGGADAFFTDLRREYGEAAPTWSGELYLELHRGTLTSQRAMKAGNRGCESRLRTAELVWTMCLVAGRGTYPADRLRRIWERVLLLQFHDILPGSSIAWVHEEARADYARMTDELDELIADGIRTLSEPGGVLNAGPFPRREVITTPAGLGLVEVEALSIHARPVHCDHPVTVQGGVPTLSNGLVSVRVAEDGTIESLVDHRHDDREVLPPGCRGAELRLHQDVPLLWDAWDLDKRHARTWSSPEPVDQRVIQSGPLRAGVETEVRVGRSTVLQRISIDADSPRVRVEVEVQWREQYRTLATYLPVSVLARESTAEIQYGHVRRPTHENTSWDAARFEALAHRWLHIGETGWGIAVVNDSTYGHSARAGVDAVGAAMTTVRLTLLRSATFPDPDQDSGTHHIRYDIVPGADIAEAIEHGYALNLPLTIHGAPQAIANPPQTATKSDHADAGTVGSPLVRVSDPGCVVEAIKAAEDGSGDVIVRCYEALGGRRRARLEFGFDVADVVETDLLENPQAPALEGRRALIADSHGWALDLRPFQLVTVRCRR
ncbi:MAG: alpha-mannosidase [Actinomycetales bacterium]